MITLAVDMSSGDLGSKAALEGVRLFQEKHPNEVNFLLVGKKEELEGAQGEIVDAKEVMPMEAGVLDALRNKESSMFKAVNSVKEKKADGVISCGGTGAFLTCATVLLRKIPGAERACLVAPFPTRIKGKRVVILDVGANNENSGKEIAQFAFMGSLYSKCVYGTKDPKVYVLSNGSEEGKGSPEGQEAYALLKERKDINFQGNLEARDVLNGDADVVATDGFSGNTLLKGTEGVAKMMSEMMKSAFKRNIFSKLGYLLSRKGFKDMKETMDYKSVGGAMLLGVNGVVVKAHGNSDGVAIFHAIEVAYFLVKNKLVDQIKEGLSQ
jgi:glycerol-3-phosphate acyltransferase PlsX